MRCRTLVRLAVVVCGALVAASSLVLAAPEGWRNVRLPIDGAYEIRDVWGSGPRDIYAVGQDGSGGVVFHSNGRGWRRVPELRISGAFSAVSGRGPADVIVGGTAGQMFQFDGARWLPVRSTLVDDITGLAPAGARGYFATDARGMVWRIGAEGAAVPPVFRTGGRRLDDIWSGGACAVAVGDAGMIGRYDGAAWSTMTVAAATLTGVWGSACDAFYVAGNSAAGGGLLFRCGPGGCAEVCRGQLPVMRAVGGAGNDVFAVGVLGTIARFDGASCSAVSGDERGLRSFWSGGSSDLLAGGTNLFLVAQQSCEFDVDCDDRIFCNGKETCDPDSKICQPGTPESCDDGNACTDDLCDAETDACVQRPAQDGATCSDGLFCNGDERCLDGTCTEGTPVVCERDANPCVEVTCDEDQDACSLTPLPDGTSCADGDFCDGAEVCRQGACVEGAPAICEDDGNPCTVERCDPQQNACVSAAAADGTACADGDFCDGAEVCRQGACVEAAPAICEDDGNPCTVERCDPQQNACVSVAAEDGTACADDDFCDGAEVCRQGECVSPGPVVCPDDGDPCTVERCDPQQNACVGVGAPDGTSCSDGQFCNGEEVCAGGQCVPGLTPSCAVTNPCTRGFCDADQNACVVVAEPDGTACSDGAFCNGSETCMSGQCAPGSAVGCDDGRPCTVDSCNENLDRCVHILSFDGEMPAGPDGVCDTRDDNLALFGPDGRCGTSDDGRGDGPCNAIDNCPSAWNPDQADGDGDGSGDACDARPCRDDAVVLALPDLEETPGERLIVPVALSDVSGLGVLSADLTVQWNPGVLEAVDVRLGSLSGGCSMAENLATPGKAGIAVFCTAPLSGAGSLAEIVFDVIGARGMETPLDLVSAVLNEGNPAVCLDDGSLVLPTHLDIRGRIAYYRESTGAEPSDKMVDGALVDLAAAAPLQETTGCFGTYAFAGVPADLDYASTPSKSGDDQGAITPFDAALVARHVVGLALLTAAQQLAADVSGNGGVSSFDAALIAQYSVGLPAAPGVGGWIFVPAPQPEPNQTATPPDLVAGTAGTIAYAPLIEDAELQNYLGILRGDVSGNWRPVCPDPVASASVTAIPGAMNQAAATALTGRAPARVALPRLSARAGDVLRVPVRATGAPDAVSFLIEIGYDPSVLSLRQITSGSSAVSFAVAANGGAPGRARLALYSATPLAVDGEIAVATFEVIGRAGARSDLSLATVSINEGAVAVETREGSVRIRR